MKLLKKTLEQRNFTTQNWSHNCQSFFRFI